MNRRGTNVLDRIEVLGLWDTVVSLGIFERLFEPAPMLGIPSIVGKVYHYVSIDENRIQGNRI